MDEACPLRPEDKVNAAELARVALILLRELAAEDPSIADRARHLGIELKTDA